LRERRLGRRGRYPPRSCSTSTPPLVTSHSEKERAAGNFKRGFGFHPLLCHLDASGEALAGVLRPGSAGSNTAADHVDVLKAAVYQLPAIAFDKEILARADSGGATHEFVDALRELDIRFSVGFDLTAAVREAVLNTPETAWRPALTQDGDERDGAGVSELVGSNLSGWPPGSRVICRRERPHPGAQLTFTDHNGYRFQCFLTDQQGTTWRCWRPDTAPMPTSRTASVAPSRPDLRISPSTTSPPTRCGSSWCSQHRT
jgi:hypothetical protein